MPTFNTATLDPKHVHLPHWQCPPQALPIQLNKVLSLTHYLPACLAILVNQHSLKPPVQLPSGHPEAFTPSRVSPQLLDKQLNTTGAKIWRIVRHCIKITLMFDVMSSLKRNQVYEKIKQLKLKKLKCFGLKKVSQHQLLVRGSKNQRKSSVN